MTQTSTDLRSAGTYTVLDVMLFVAACSVSVLLIRLLRPAAPTWEDYLVLTAYCGPAGLAVFGPWAVRRQFLDSRREELVAGEWMWIALGGAWMAATPMMLATGGQGVKFFTGLVAVLALVPGIVALLQSLPIARRLPWTHWAGIFLCLLHAAPAVVLLGPLLWDMLDRLYQVTSVIF